MDADGVHIGQSDMEYTKAREILGPDKIIGCQLKFSKARSERVGADYIGVGQYSTQILKRCHFINDGTIKRNK
ncbi:MAG: thiamine phosphate synthase [Intestinibacter bartlettii]